MTDILLVEDDDIDIEAVTRAFDSSGLPVKLYIAKNGIEALNKIYAIEGEAFPTPKLIILDINMPQMNGIEFLKKIRSDNRFNETNILILTTSMDFTDKSATYNLNIAGYIVKPFDKEELITHCKILL